MVGGAAGIFQAVEGNTMGVETHEEVTYLRQRVYGEN